MTHEFEIWEALQKRAIVQSRSGEQAFLPHYRDMVLKGITLLMMLPRPEDPNESTADRNDIGQRCRRQTSSERNKQSK
jgi:hypothetical protein